jgi:hypothetical protein
MKKTKSKTPVLLFCLSLQRETCSDLQGQVQRLGFSTVLAPGKEEYNSHFSTEDEYSIIICVVSGSVETDFISDYEMFLRAYARYNSSHHSKPTLIVATDTHRKSEDRFVGYGNLVSAYITLPIEDALLKRILYTAQNIT